MRSGTPLTGELMGGDIVYCENALTVREYMSLREAVGWKVLSEEQSARAVAGSIHTVNARAGGMTAAMGRLIGDGVYYLIADIAVVPKFQGQGIGGGIIDRLLAFAERNTPEGGASCVMLTAEKGRERFYLRKGFKPLPNESAGSAFQLVIRKYTNTDPNK